MDILDKIDEQINEEFIIDSEIADKIFKDIEIASNSIVMNTILGEIKKHEKKIYKKYGKYGVNEHSTMFVRHLGSAMIHDIFRQVIGHSILSVTGNLKKPTRQGVK